MKPSDRKIQGGGGSALTALKARCLREFERDKVSSTLDQIMQWAADEKNTNAIIRHRVGEFFNIDLSRDSQLSCFYSWVKLTRKTMEREGKIQHWLECEKLEHPELSDAELFRRGQRKFNLLAIAEEDPESWVKIQKEQREREQLVLDRQKFEFDAAKLALSAVAQLKTISASKLSDVEKIDAARKALFGELPETQEAKK